MQKIPEASRKFEKILWTLTVISNNTLGYFGFKSYRDNDENLPIQRCDSSWILIEDDQKYSYRLWHDTTN